MEGTVSIKSDIFSFGVLIREIVSGRRNSSFIHLDQTFNLIEYAWKLWQQGDAITERPNAWKYLYCTTILEERPCRPSMCAKSATDRSQQYDFNAFQRHDDVTETKHTSIRHWQSGCEVNIR